MTVMKRALVLSGGGAAGQAWLLGVISGLRKLGADLGEADLIVGTSAGARAGAQLATGVLDQAVEALSRGQLPVAEVYATLPQFVAASMRIIAGSPNEREAARRIANMGPLGSQLASGAGRRQQVAAQLPVTDWPRQRLLITAVDAESGERAVFDAHSGADLADAVTASGALPGIYPLVTINGRCYADGGVHSLYHADLAAGHEVVVILSPMPVSDYTQAQLEAETAGLGPAAIRIITPDQHALAAIGPDANSPAAIPAALRAGTAQARQEVGTLTPHWQSGRDSTGGSNE